MIWWRSLTETLVSMEFSFAKSGKITIWNLRLLVCTWFHSDGPSLVFVPLVFTLKALIWKCRDQTLFSCMHSFPLPVSFLAVGSVLSVGKISIVLEHSRELSYWVGILLEPVVGWRPHAERWGERRGGSGWKSFWIGEPSSVGCGDKLDSTFQAWLNSKCPFSKWLSRTFVEPSSLTPGLNSLGTFCYSLY